MWRRLLLVRIRAGLAGLLLAGSVLVLGVAPRGQTIDPALVIAVADDAARGWGRAIEEHREAGTLRLSASTLDTMIDGRAHDRFDQYVGDARVFGAQLVRQRSAEGVVTVFGRLHPGLRLETEPRIGPAAAVARAAALTGRQPLQGRRPELVVLPLDDGSYRLAWYVRVLTGGDLVALFLDAASGDEVFRYSDLQTQAAVGAGTGVLGDRKKISARLVGGFYLADDALRPPSLVTYDLKGSPDRTFAILDGAISPAQSDIASDTDNDWADGPNVDTHAYVGFTYDYLFKRFQRRGLDGNDRPIRSIVHPANRDDLVNYPDEVLDLFILNAFWCGACGSNGTGFMVFGEGLPGRFFLTATGQNVTYFSAGFDVVAHELTHAVTEFSSGLVYRNESGALNEAFSDIVAVGADFFSSATGALPRTSNYVLGEEVFTPLRPGSRAGIRSLSDPAAFNNPDHYSRRFRGSEDNGGVHINSGIPAHAFYLAIEGGTNRTSGLAVQGVGGANREQVERVFFRAFTQFLPPTATFAMARQATERAAAELYGGSSAAFRAVSQAWTAVGVN